MLHAIDAPADHFVKGERMRYPVARGAFGVYVVAVCCDGVDRGIPPTVRDTEVDFLKQPHYGKYDVSENDLEEGEVTLDYEPDLAGGGPQTRVGLTCKAVFTYAGGGIRMISDVSGGEV